MTRDDVFRWSQEARVVSGSEPVNITALQRFAALVAAAEREACALVAESYEPTCETCPSGVANAIRARSET